MARGHVEKARDRATGQVIRGKWVVVAELGRHGASRPRRTVTVHGSEDDAHRALTGLLHELDTGRAIDPATLTVGDLLARWLDDYARAPGRLSPTTVKRYESIIERHLVPALGHLRLQRLQPMQVQAYYTAALRTLAPATVRQHHAVLHKALSHAVRLRLRGDNPADAVEAPTSPRRAISAPTPAEMAALIEAARGHYLYAAVVLAATTGMRRGEIAGLRWRDVDLRGRMLHVDGALIHQGDGVERKAPKSSAGRRSITLGGATVDALRGQKADQGRRRKALHGQYVESPYVADAPMGGPMRPDAISSGFRYIARRAGLPHVRFHDLRHGHASALMRLDHPKLVSERLGHSSVAFTMATYQHVTEAQHRAAADAFDGLLDDAGGASWAVNGQKNAPVTPLRRGRSSGKSPAK